MAAKDARPAPSAHTVGTGEPRYKWKVLASVVVGLFMVILDATVINVALRALQQKYAVSTSEVQWVISLYTLALGIATPLSGFLGDRLGIKRVYLGGLALFVLGSVLCGFAPSLPLLIAARAIQGVGGGIALPLGTALLFGAFPPQQRGVAFGIFGIVLVFAPASGPLLGGWLVDHGLIPWIFFINLPVGLLGLVIGGRFLREERKERHGRADLAGLVLAPLGVGALLFAASIAGDQGAGWGDPRVLAGLAAGVVLLAALVVAELRAEEPLLVLRLFAIPSFAIANVAGLVGTVALFGAEFLLPLYLQVLRGQSAFDAGVLLLPLAIASGIVAPFAGQIADRIGPRVPIVAGFLLIAFNTYELSKLTLTTSLGYIVFLLVLRGVGVALVIQNSQVAALADVPLPQLTRATPLVNATRQTAQAIGVAVLATILASAVTATLPAAAASGGIPSAGALSRLPAAARAAAEAGIHRFQAQYLSGLEHAYLAACVIAVIATVLSLFLPGWPGAWRARSAARTAGAPSAESTGVEAWTPHAGTREKEDEQAATPASLEAPETGWV